MNECEARQRLALTPKASRKCGNTHGTKSAANHREETGVSFYALMGHDNKDGKEVKYNLRTPIYVSSEEERDKILDKWVYDCEVQKKHLPEPLIVVEAQKTPQQQFQALIHPKFSHQKAWVTGDVFEVHSIYDEMLNPMPFMYDFSLGKTSDEMIQEAVSHVALQSWVDEMIEKNPSIVSEILDIQTPEPEPVSLEQQAVNRKKSLARAKHDAQLIIRKYRFYMMWTFTFALEPETEEDKKTHKDMGIYHYLSQEEQQNRKTVGKAWNNFMTQLRKYCNEHDIPLQWLKVLERHDSDDTSEEKRNTFHVHLATNLSYFNKKDLQKMWGYGEIEYSDYSKKQVTTSDGRKKNVDLGCQGDASFYMSKYIEKNFDDAHERKEKAFTTSTNVKTPKPIRDTQSIQKKKENPPQAFDLEGMNPQIRVKLQHLKDIHDIEWKLPDVGYGSGVYSIQWTERDADGNAVERKGFKQIEIFDARLLLPEYRKRYEARLKAREEEKKKQKGKPLTQEEREKLKAYNKTKR